MSITDELREWMRARGMMAKETFDQLTAIADRIDAAHRSALEKLAAQVDETSDMREFCGRIEQAANNREDVTLWGVDYVPLPVDADGVPIRPGDNLTIVETCEHIRAYDVELYDEGRWIVCDDKTMDSIHPDRLRHRAPTVEDVLREFAREIDADAYGITDAKITEFAAKLRLAGEGEWLDDWRDAMMAECDRLDERCREVRDGQVRASVAG